MTDIVEYKMSIGEAVNRRNAMVEFAKVVMVNGTDYGVIPGTDKPTLLKPGAEKLVTLFGWGAEFQIIESTADWEKGFFYYSYRCTLRARDGHIVATGEGSCNTKEKKYRWRNVYENQATDEDKANGKRIKKQGKSGRDYFVYQVENTEPFDLVNTVQKMAQKRALVAACLIGANASEFYTQDLEDMVIEGDYSEVSEKPRQIAQPERLVSAPDGSARVAKSPKYTKAELTEAENMTGGDGMRYGDRRDDQLRWVRDNPKSPDDKALAATIILHCRANGTVAETFPPGSGDTDKPETHF